MLRRLEDGGARADEDALRLALLTMGTEDAQQLRKEIGRHAILQALEREPTALSAERELQK